MGPSVQGTNVSLVRQVKMCSVVICSYKPGYSKYGGGARGVCLPWDV